VKVVRRGQEEGAEGEEAIFVVFIFNEYKVSYSLYIQLLHLPSRQNIIIVIYSLGVAL